MEYLSWSISPERQKHEWMLLRRSLVKVRLGFLAGGHALYFAACGLAAYLGKVANFSHLIWVGFWTMFFFGLALLLMDLIHGQMMPTHTQRFAIRKSGLTQYGADGPVAHFDWRRKRHLRIESDAKRPEYRALILCELRRFRWVREIAQVRVPLPSPDESVGEVEIVRAMHDAIEDAGLTWTAASDGTIVVLG